MMFIDGMKMERVLADDCTTPITLEYSYNTETGVKSEILTLTESDENYKSAAAAINELGVVIRTLHQLNEINKKL